MYTFLAHYINMDNGKEITRKIGFEERSLENEKECYLYAMSIAYEMKHENECFSSLEFISC